MMQVHFFICLLTYHSGMSHPKGTTVTLTATVSVANCIQFATLSTI
jgi:hypothetical protein